MIPYIICLVLTILFVSLAEKNLNQDKKIKGIALLIIGILPMVFLAGFRTVTMGWDVVKYLVKIFNCSQNMSLDICFSRNQRIEKGFIVLVYLLVKMSGNINFVMFFLELIVTACFTIFAYNYRRKCSLKLSFLIYFCTLYVITYSTLRQSITIAIVMLSILLMEKKKYLLSLILILLGLLTHDSAIFALPILCIFILCDNTVNNRARKFVIILIIAALLFGTIFYEEIIQHFYNMGLISDVYIKYLSEESKYSHGKFSLFMFIYKTIILFLSYLLCKTDKKEEKTKWFVMLIIDYIFMFLSFKIVNIFRVTYYYFFPAIFVMCPQFKNIFKNDKASHMLVNVAVALLFIVYFLYRLLTNYYNMYPYQWIF